MLPRNREEGPLLGFYVCFRVRWPTACARERSAPPGPSLFGAGVIVLGPNHARTWGHQYERL